MQTNKKHITNFGNVGITNHTEPTGMIKRPDRTSGLCSVIIRPEKKSSLFSLSFDEKPLDKLAQKEQNQSKCLNKQTDKTPKNFTEITENLTPQNLISKARAKYFTNRITNELKKLNSPLRQSYLNTFYCNCNVTKTEYENSSLEYRAKYCKNRVCIVCNRIKTAETITKYEPEIKTWHSLYLVTLTRPNVKADNLPKEVNKYIESYNTIIKKIKRADKNFKAVRKIEITYNHTQDTFHPHFHILVNSFDNAEMLLKVWLNLNKKADKKAQDIRQADQDAIKEIAKYMTKIIQTDSNKTKKYIDRDGKIISGQDTRKVYISALDTILQALSHKRTITHTGFKIVKEPELEQVKETIKSVEYYTYFPEITDWVEKETGERLTNYEPSEMFQSIEVESVNKELSIIERIGYTMDKNEIKERLRDLNRQYNKDALEYEVKHPPKRPEQKKISSYENCFFDYEKNANLRE